MTGVHSPHDAETRFVETLRPRYEGMGFTFIVNPPGEQLPDFLGSYKPHALARKQGDNVAIEVKQHAPSNERSLKDIQQLFKGHPDWHLHVVSRGMHPLDSLQIPPADPETIRTRTGEVRALAAQGHRPAAFFLAWTLLEAVLRTRHGEGERPREAEMIVQTLAMYGYVEPETERRLRERIELRNRVAHGDLTAKPTAGDIAFVLSAIEEALSADAA